MVEGNGSAIQVESVTRTEVAKPPFDAVLVFGQGPVIDEATRNKAADADSQKADINFWSQEAAKAATELFKRGQVAEIIVMGGKTGGEGYKSEADLIAEKTQELGIPSDVIKKESRSTNTLENLVNLINQYPEITDPTKKIAILGADYHMSRIRQLMDMFELQYAGVFSAEAVAKYAALGTENEAKTLDELERRLDINAASKNPTELAPGHYSKQQGTEQKDIHRRVQEEYFLSRALLEEPKYWLGYVGGIDNTDLMMRIVNKQDPKVLQEVFAIDLVADTPDTIRQKLLPFRSEKRYVPPVEQWINEPYPEESARKLEELVDKRTEREE